MNRFSEIIELDRDQITVDPEIFQGRQTEFSEDTVKSIVSKGHYDKSAEPIVVWKDPSKGKYIVISGHSRWEASKRLFNSGKQPDLKQMPVKVFLGDQDDAVDYATLESNRASTEEGLISDLQAYRRAISKGFNREKLLSIFKPESKLQKLKELSYLNPKGKFVEELSKPSSRSFPYLERNARWVGQLRKMLPQLTDSHETELFNYFYKGKQANLKLTKDKFFDLIDKRVNRIDFDAEQALNLENRISSNALTDPITEQIKEIEQDIQRFQNRIQKKRESIIRASETSIPDEEKIIAGLKNEISNYEKAILRKMEEQNRLRQQKGKIERETVVDLFSSTSEEVKKEEPAKERISKKAIDLEEGVNLERYPRTHEVGDLVNAVRGGKKYFGVNITGHNFHEGSFLYPSRWEYYVEIEGKPFQLKGKIENFNPQTERKGAVKNAYPLLDPTGSMYKTARSAWSWSSMRSEDRGEHFMNEHEGYLEGISEKFSDLAQKHGTLELLEDELSRFIDKYRDFAKDYLHRQSNIASSMVTGPARFPVAQMEKRNNAQRNLELKWNEWEKKAIKRIEKTLKNEPVPTGNPTEELGRQQEKLQGLKSLQQEYKDINSAFRRYKKNPSTLESANLSDKNKKLIQNWKQEYSWEKAPIAPYQLSNLNASIKRTEQRVKELKAKSSIAKSGSAPEVSFEGGTVVLNATDNRIQIFFDDKPGPEARTELKKAGFKWAPSKKAWQRMITDNALRSTAWLSFIKHEGPYQELFKVTKEEPSEEPLKQPKFKVGDSVNYQGEIYEIGFINNYSSGNFSGKYRLQQGPTGKQVKVYEDEITLAEPKAKPVKDHSERHEYHLLRRPPSIGTHPTENFLEYVEDGSRHGLLTYSKPLPLSEVKRYELAPITDLKKYDDKIVDYAFGNNKIPYKVKVKKNFKGFYIVEMEPYPKHHTAGDFHYSGIEFLEAINEGKITDHVKPDDSKKDAKVPMKERWVEIVKQSGNKIEVILDSGRKALINRHKVVIFWNDKLNRYDVNLDFPGEYLTSHQLASMLFYNGPKGVQTTTFKDQGETRTRPIYKEYEGKRITWKIDENHKKSEPIISEAKLVEGIAKKEGSQPALKDIAASMRNILNRPGEHTVKVVTKNFPQRTARNHILVELKNGKPLDTDPRLLNILKSWPIDQKLIKGYGAIIYPYHALKAYEEIKSYYIPGSDDEKEHLACPPTKNGERLIDSESISRLEKCIQKQPQTKELHTNANGEYSNERLKLHAKIISKFKTGAQCTGDNKPVAILTGGAPGSGKSTFLKKYAPWLLSDAIYHIDADEVRAKLPEYEGWNASATHEETSDITKKLIDNIGRPCEYDLIYDGTMNKAKKYKPLVKQLKDLNYEVYVIYLQVPEKVSRQRVLERYKRSGRYVPMAVIDEIYDKGLEAYEEVIQSADGFIRVDGVSQKIIEKGGKEIPKRRELGTVKGKTEPTPKDKATVEAIRKEIVEYVTLSEDQVLSFALKLNSLRAVRSQLKDSGQINKKVVPLTAEGLFRWAKNPGAYDLPGVDAPEGVKPTVKPRKIKKLEKPNKSAGNFWQKIWNG